MNQEASGALNELGAGTRVKERRCVKKAEPLAVHPREVDVAAAAALSPQNPLSDWMNHE